MEKGYEGIETIETEGYRAGSEYGLKTIIYKQLQRCIDEGSKEMTSGGIITRIIDGRPIDIAVLNQREIYINCCEHLKILLLEHIKKNKKIIKELTQVDDFIKSFDDKEKGLNEKFEDEIKKTYAPYSKLSFRNQDKYADRLNVNIQRIKNKFEGEVIGLWKNEFLIVIPYLLSKTNFFGED